ncbi:hypothetical protein E0F51_07515 [Streptococcus pyogenes]|nr:putative cytosolic protein [Streptococcus pyogenes MGAS6180]AAZ52275.1 putative cytosolic protein [Streptococcus pyogenes MGAS5005]ASO69071.1 hypothetical protein CFA72_08780 [Streptococcus pyogenes]BAN59888.1 cytoplasmic protein [Streptococcus pyogenes M1 476]ASO74786.1 hypothetical protein B2G65_08780 [Streptococcus pyogenes]
MILFLRWCLRQRLPLEFHALVLSLRSQKSVWASLSVLIPLLPQQKAAVLAHPTCRNRKPDVKSADLFMLFEHKSGFVYFLKPSQVVKVFR